jgi:glucan phosphoethanolaminetransferase (alkaline phosphatase superfamily)
MNSTTINNGDTLNHNGLNTLIEKLQSRDTYKKNVMKRFMIAYAVILVLYIIILIIDIANHEPVLQLFDHLIYVVAMAIFVFLFRYRFLEQKEIDYSAPLLDLLSEAKKRYKPWRPIVWIAVFGAVITGIPFSRSFTDHLPQQWDNFSRSLIVFGIYMFFIGLAILIGQLIWRKNNRPMVQHINKMLEELNNSGA